MTTGLTNEFAFGFDGLADGFAVSYLRLAYGAFNVEFTSHAVNDDVQMEFAHAGDDRLVGFWIGIYSECRSSSASLWRALPIFSWSALVFGSTATEITGSGNSIFSRIIG